MTKTTAQQPTLSSPGAAAQPPLELDLVREIRPAKRRLTLRGLMADLPVVRVLAARDFKVKYKQSLLGPLWLVFQPVAMLAAFFIAFRQLADVESSGTPYLLFSLVGLSVWTFFQASMTIGAASIVSNMALVRFTPCPRIAFPLAGMIASLPSFAVPGVAALVAAFAYGDLSPRVLLLPAGVLWMFLLTAAVIAVASAYTVKFRDMVSALPFLLQVGLFLAPVGYPLADLSPTTRAIVDCNPVTGLIEGMRWIIIADYQPSFEPIGISLGLTPLLAVVGWRVFTRNETTMADEI